MAYYENNRNIQREILEAIRIQTFHLANLRKGTSFKSFCKSYFPYSWDKAEKNEVDSLPEIGYDESVEIQRIWDEIAKNEKKTTVVSFEDATKIDKG